MNTNSPSTAQQMATYAVTRNVLDLMAMGKVWPAANVEIHDGVVEVSPPMPWSLRQQDVDRMTQVMEVVRREFPNGKDTVMSHRPIGGTRGRPLLDQVRYQVRILDVLILVTHYIPHTHPGYHGFVSQADRPEWRCTGCKKRITTTEARRLGLLPQLERKNRHATT